MNNIGFGANVNNNVYGGKKDDTTKVLAKGALIGAGTSVAVDLVEIGYAAKQNVNFEKKENNFDKSFKDAFKEAWGMFKENGNVSTSAEDGAIVSKKPLLFENLKGYKRHATFLAGAAGLGAALEYAIHKFKN